MTHAIENNSGDALVVSVCAITRNAVITMTPSEDYHEPSNPKLDAIERENSTPQNAIVVSMFSVDAQYNPTRQHTKCDERGNAVSDQKKRGGIAG